MSTLFAVKNVTTGEYATDDSGTTRSPEMARHYKRYSDARRLASRIQRNRPNWQAEVVAFKLQPTEFVSPDEQRILSRLEGEPLTARTLATAVIQYLGRAVYDDRVDAIAGLIDKVTTHTPLPANNGEAIKEREVIVIRQPTVV